MMVYAGARLMAVRRRVDARMVFMGAVATGSWPGGGGTRTAGRARKAAAGPEARRVVAKREGRGANCGRVRARQGADAGA